MARINVGQVIGKMKIGNADKLILTSLFAALVDDLETVRANQRTQATKLDTAGGTVATLGTNYAATASTAPGGLAVGK